MAKTQFLHHEFGPLYHESSKVLILGSFPSVKSREINFYYGHPQNRFWRIILGLFDQDSRAFIEGGVPISPPSSIQEKKSLILDHDLALWDSIESCTITGSSDQSIQDVTANDISVILEQAPIRVIACNGTASHKIFVKYALPKLTQYCENLGMTVPTIIKLPSSSPANAAWSLPKLLHEWEILLQYLD